MAVGEAHQSQGVLLLAAPLLGLPAHAQMTCDPCKVGVVFDGPWALNALLRESFEKEVAALATPRHRTACSDFSPSTTCERWWMSGAASSASSS